MNELIIDLSQNIEYDNLLLQFYVFLLTWLNVIGVLSWTM